MPQMLANRIPKTEDTPNGEVKSLVVEVFGFRMEISDGMLFTNKRVMELSINGQTVVAKPVSKPSDGSPNPEPLPTPPKQRGSGSKND